MKAHSVLIVDDSALVRRSLKSIFEDSGWNVVGEADNGERAVEMAEKLEPAVVTMDVAMPVMNGIDAAKRLMMEAPQILVILCTSHAGDRHVVKALGDAGIKTVISKADAFRVLIPTAEKLAAEARETNFDS